VGYEEPHSRPLRVLEWGTLGGVLILRKDAGQLIAVGRGVFAFVGRPRGFDGDDPRLVESVVTIAAPLPLFGFLDEAALYGVAVNVLKVVDEFLVVADVAVVVTALPKGCPLCLVAHICLPLADVGLFVSRGRNFQRLDKRCNRALLRLGDEQMHVIGHDYKTVDEEFVAKTSALEDSQECIADRRGAQKRLPSIAGEGDEVRQTGLVETIKSPRHVLILAAAAR